MTMMAFITVIITDPVLSLPCRRPCYTASGMIPELYER